MSDFGNWPLLERISNGEFLKLLPHLNLEHSFLTQVFTSKKKWMPLLDANFQSLHVKCNSCRKEVRFDKVKDHLIQTDHIISLRSEVKQFYHPFYTYGKGDVELARGEPVPLEVRKSTLRELNTQMKSFKKYCATAKEIVGSIHQKIQEIENEQFLQLSSDATIENPENMFVKAYIPCEDIPKLFFCGYTGKWQPVVDYRNLTKKANFHCNICAIHCSGIESLNSHFDGYTHKARQLELLALRYDLNSRVNKNFCFQFGDVFSISVREGAETVFEINNKNKMKLNKSLHLQIPKEVLEKISVLDKHMPELFPGTMENSHFRFEINAADSVENLNRNEILGHLGVEYVLKIMKNEDDKDPKFECGLCEFVGNGNKMQRHLLNYDHKKKYLDLHYSDTIKKYESALGHMRFMEFRAVMGEIVHKIATEVEKIHSRSLPYTVSTRDYSSRRPDLIADVYALLHASQNRGPSFSNILSNANLKNLKDSASALSKTKTYNGIDFVVFTTPPKDRVYLKQKSHDPVVRLKDYFAKMNKTHANCKRRSSTPSTKFHDLKSSRNERDYEGGYGNRSRSRSPLTSRCISPGQGPFRAGELSNASNQNIWDIYRREIAIAANEIEIAYEKYRKNPENHPLYEEEWNIFWQQRKKELAREGFNHRMYDFQPEWVHYFKNRIELLFGEALQKSQIIIRRNLGIPLDAEEDCQHSHNQFEPNKKGNACLAVESGKDIFETYKRHSYSDCAESKRSFPEEKNLKNSEHINFQQPQSLVTNISDNHSNVVHVLRLMTALEEYLGSLGAKVMDLLSNALQLEKSFRGNCVEFEARILTTSNCQLLETAMEKLKGILFAGLLDEKKNSGLKRVIQYTSNLLKYAEKMEWRNDTFIKGNDFHSRNMRTSAENMCIIQNKGGRVPTLHEKKLSDTLLDLVNTSKTDESYKKSDQNYTPVDCPSPPIIKGSNQILDKYKLQSSNSGLSSFDTRFSLDQSNQIQMQSQNQSFRSDFGQLHLNAKREGNNLNNNTFKNNNDTRTNNSISNKNTDPSASSCTVNNFGPMLQYRNSQFNPILGQNNTKYQGLEDAARFGHDGKI